MDMFKRLSGKTNIENGESATVEAEPTGWEGVKNMPFQGEVSRGAEQQERNEEQEKLEKRLARYENSVVSALSPVAFMAGPVEPIYLSSQKREASKAERDVVVDAIRRGFINRIHERAALETVMRPCDFPGGIKETMSKITSLHERRILADMSGGDFYNPDGVTEDNLAEFLRRYKTPIDFDRMAVNFLDGIEAANGLAKRRGYEADMANFRLKVYGKQEECWICMKRLEKEGRRQAGERSLKRDSHEMERSSEWEPGYPRALQISRRQAGAIKAGALPMTIDNVESVAWKDQAACEDSCLCDSSRQIYGVFDGAGGHGGGKKASSLANDVMAELSMEGKLNSATDLKFALNEANRRVINDKDAGFTTGVITKVIERGGQRTLAYASVGDSRLYIISKEGVARQITRDEGEGKYLWNAIGNAEFANVNIVSQVGEIPLQKGDRIMLCTDGITGDYGDDLVSEDEIGRVVGGASDALTAAKRIMTLARKRDDRTVIVIGE